MVPAASCRPAHLITYQQNIEMRYRKKNEHILSISKFKNDRKMAALSDQDVRYIYRYFSANCEEVQLLHDSVLCAFRELLNPN